MAGQYAGGGEIGLFFPGEHPQGQTKLGPDEFGEGGTILGLAHGCGCDGDDVVGRPVLENGAEAAQGAHRHLNPFGGEASSVGHVTTEARQGLLVIDRPDGAAFQPVDDQADRV